MGGSIKEYQQHLFDDTTDGYIQIMHLENERIKVYNTDIKGLRKVTQEVHKKENEELSKDTFITANTMYIPSRRVSNIRQFRALFMDIDNIEGDELFISYKLIELSEDNIIPKPTMIVQSGRGIHVYWRIKNAPYGALSTWQELEDFLYHNLKKYGADPRATDAARVLRLPNTINSKNNKECRVIYIDDKLEYSMYDLREKYLNYSAKPQQLSMIQVKKSNNTSKKVINNKFFNSYSLHMARAEDLLILCDLRNYEMTGYRNMALHCYAYWKGIYIREIEELEKEVIDLNNSFTLPLKDSQVFAITRCVPKAIEKFIAYEQGIRSGELKRVSKGMRDKQGYWYKNETLIERLDITLDEQKHLKTIIGVEEKYRRNNEKRKIERRGEDGLTDKQREMQALTEKVLELKKEGFSIRKIAEAVGKSRGSIENILKGNKKS